MHLDQDIAVAISAEYFRSISTDVTKNIYCIHESGFSSTHGLNFLVRDDFEFKRELDRFISMANEGGLISKWMADLGLEHVTQHEDKNKSEVTMAHIISLLIVCGSCIFLTLLVFLVEILIYKQKSKSNAGKFWSFAELVIDPERHFLNYDLRYILPVSYCKLK